MTPLTGTPKQVEWATKIRAQVLADVARLRQDVEADGQRAFRRGTATANTITQALTIVDTAAARLDTHTEAVWWINHRGDYVRELLAAEMEA